MDIVERHIEVGGLTVQLWEAGQQHGRAVLLLHGGIGDACANWHQALPGLSEDYHVFAPNLPGYGDSALLPDMTIDCLLVWLRDLLDELKLHNAVLIGSFIGALLVRLFATAQPTYTPAVIMVNGGGIPNFPRPLPALLRLPVIGSAALELFGLFTASRKPLEEMMYVKDAITPELVASWQQNQPGFKHLIRALILGRYPLKSVPPVPALLLWGANDPMMPLTSAEHLQEIIPGITLAPILDCGLMPQLEATDTFAFQVNAFLDKLNRPRAANFPGAGMLRPR